MYDGKTDIMAKMVGGDNQGALLHTGFRNIPAREYTVNWFPN
jgi:hypothetical protein